MGTTIKREPVSFNIPKSPDYKFLNITEFGGLSVSSNPFVVSSNTASDCLNVYVDEDNALSTRPRLQPKWDLFDIVGLNDRYTIIGVYELHNGYLLHVTKDSNYYMYKILETDGNLEQPKQITGNIPRKHCNVFEQNGLIYVLDGDVYKYITTDNNIRNVEGYIPTAITGSTKTTDGEPLESLNILTPKFKETYYWDGTWELSEIEANQSNVENGYINTYLLYGDLAEFKPVKTFSSYGGIRQIMYKDSNDKTRMYQTGFPDETTQMPQAHGPMSKPSDAPTSPIDIYGDISEDGSVLAYCYAGLDGGLFVRRNSVWTKISEDTDLFDTTGDVHIAMSDNGDVIATYTTTHFLIATWNDDQYAIERIGLNDNVDLSNASVMVSGSGSVAVIKYSDTYDNNDWIYAYKNGKTVGSVHGVETGRVGSMALSKDGNYFALTDITNKNVRLYSNYLENNSEYTVVFDTLTAPKTMSLAFSKDKLYVVSGNNSSDNGWYWLDTQQTIHYDTLYGQKEDFGIVMSNEALPQTQDSTLIMPFWSTNIEGYAVINFNFASTEPLLSVTRTLDRYGRKHPDEALRSELIDKLNKATLHKRFDNNTWFASGNYTFHTQYNNPTYIPLSSYNDLGEDYEEITGLGIVNDNVLVAYKRDKLYIITPITVGDTLTYSYTETKNVIGNVVVNAPILTTLTEMPTQVSYDGIFALNQLQNVQSGDRITTLISENINPRWLKESKADIDRTITLNRLYWTYYILPHNEKTTKIYLLDNRTQQWYYWELPMFVVSAMVKNNRTHFADANGRIYTLETSDTINEYNPDVTEYYDKINNKKLLIPWHWYSQILSLNTINYSKKLVDTTFILTDTDTQDEYGLDYSFIAWRKSVSETNKTTISNKINYVQSTTKRTMIPRFNFIQFRLSNTSDDLDNNKLRLVGLGLKYVLLEGLY